MKVVLEVAQFMLGFLPWLLFLFLPTDGWESLCRAVLICWVASFVSWRDLRRGFILQWASMLFFFFCAVSFYGFKWVWLAENMGIIANCYLVGIIWLTILVGRPFTLQYARGELPKERWNDANLVKGCRSIAIFWGVLLLVPVGFSVFKIFYPKALPEWVYFWQSLLGIFVGVVYTTYYKRSKRQPREAE